MNAGFHILPVLLGVFALGQVLQDSVDRTAPPERTKVKRWIHFEPFSVWLGQTVNLVRSRSSAPSSASCPASGRASPRSCPTRWPATPRAGRRNSARRSEEHTSELQSLMRISYAVFCLKKKKKQNKITRN